MVAEKKSLLFPDAELVCDLSMRGNSQRMNEEKDKPLPGPKPQMPPPRPPRGTEVAVAGGDAGPPKEETVRISLPPKPSAPSKRRWWTRS